MLGRGVGPMRRRASFTLRFAIILAVLGVLIAGATAAIPLDLAASETRNAALDRAANKAGVAANLVAGQRQSLHAFVGGVAGSVAGPLSSGDTSTALQALTRESLVTASGDLLGATLQPNSAVLHQGTALSEDDATRLAMLSGVATGREWVLDESGTPWLLDYVAVPSSVPSVTVFVARPMRQAFISNLAADLGSGNDSAQIAVVHDGVVGADTSLAGVDVREGLPLPSSLQPALGATQVPVLLTVEGRSIAAASASIGNGLSLLVTTFVGPSAGFLSTVVGPVAIIAAAMILLSLLVVFTMVQRDLQRPLRRLDRAVAGLAQDDFDVPIPAGGDDELGRLATTFEQMRRTLRATLAGAEARAAIAQELNSAQPLQNALTNVCELLRSTTDSHAAVFVVAHTDMADAFLSGVGLEREVDVDRLLRGGGAIAGAMEMDGTVPLQAVALPGCAEAEAGMREICASPLRIGSHTFGVVAVADKSLGFNAADLALVSAVAEQTALSLERYRILAVVQRQASTDELTSLYNYRFLVDYLDQQIALAERLKSSLAVLMLDLDRFKSLNDTHGHHAGDEALRSFAKTLRASIRRSDLAARYGGEEFVVVMANTNGEEARLVAEKIRRAVSDLDLRLGPEAVETHVTVSIGGVAFPDDTGDARGLLRLADDALYRAKRTGRNRVCFVSDNPRRRTLARTAPRADAKKSDEGNDERSRQADRPAQ